MAPPPFTFSLEEGGGEEGLALPPFLSLGLAGLVEGHTSPLWAGLPLPWPIKPVCLPGVPETPSGDPVST